MTNFVLSIVMSASVAWIGLDPSAFAAAEQPDGDEGRSISRQVQLFKDDDDIVKVILEKHGAAPETLEWVTVNRGFLGVHLIDLTAELRAHFGAPEDAGVMVARVEPDSPAAKAGVKVGDIITKLGDKKIDSTWEATKEIGAKKEGEAAAIEIWRDKRVTKMTVTIAARSKPQIDIGDILMFGHPAKQLEVFLDRSRLPRLSEDLRPAIRERIERHRLAEEDYEKRLQELEKKIEELEQRLKKRSALGGRASQT